MYPGKKHEVKEMRKATRNGDTLKPRKGNWIDKVCRTQRGVFFLKLSHTPKIYLQSGKKNKNFITQKN